MTAALNRRSFTTLAAGAFLSGMAAAEDAPKATPTATAAGPIEAPFSRDYAAPGFKPSWKKPQLNRQLVQDFVIFAHSDPEMVKKLLAKEPTLVSATMDWGGGDWETGLGGASHMGRRDIVEILLAAGARPDLFCAAMLGQLEIVKAWLTLAPQLIDARGPHGFSLHFHAQVGGAAAAPVLDYLQSIRKIELKPNPFLRPTTPTRPKD